MKNSVASQEAQFLRMSYDAIKRFRLPNREHVSIAIVFAMYREQRRLAPQSSDNPFGEDALRMKIRQLEEISLLNPSIHWTLLAVEASEEPNSEFPITSGQVARRQLADMPEGDFDGQDWKSRAGHITVKIAQFPIALKNRLSAKKGGAIIWGFANMLDKNDLLVYTDTDLSADLRHLGLLLAGIESGHAWVVGSRFDPDSIISGRGWPEKITSTLYATIARALLPLGRIKDTQCGYKMFTRDAMLSIIPVKLSADLTSADWDLYFDYEMSFDTELLARATLVFGAERGTEVPIVWHDSNLASTIRSTRIGGTGLNMLRGLMRQPANVKRFGTLVAKS